MVSGNGAKPDGFRVMIYRFLILLLLASPAFALDGRVVAVADGDTLSLLDESHQQHKIRLAGIDAPEKVQAFGQASKRHLSGLVFGKTITVDVMGQDKYRRTLGAVMLDGRDINAQMVADGYAWAYVRYSRDYEAAEGEARRARRGLWVDADPVPPWDFRRASKQK